VHDKSGNEQTARAMPLWAFKRNGVLRYANVQHHLVGEKTPPAAYTINDDVEYSIEIETLSEGSWKPLEATDVQLEFVRIDPFVRHSLQRSGKRFYSKFKLPDVYGVFKFSINYNRVGYTFLHSVTQVSVRPYEHTQYERFIPCAFPYYASSFSMMAGVLLLSFVFLHYREAPPAGKKTD